MTKAKTAAPLPADLLIDGGRAAYDAGEGVAKANKERATALDMIIAGLSPAMLETPIAFDVCDRAGNIVESTRASLMAYAKGFRNEDGTDNRTMQGAFRSAILPGLFGVKGDQSAGAKAVWALVTGKALPAAVALMREGMTAKLGEDGALVLEGGAGETADKLRAAAGKSTSALAKAAKDATGTNREAPQNDKDGGRAATPNEILAAAARLVEGVAKGEEALSNSALSWVIRIARIVIENPEAFKPE